MKITELQAATEIAANFKLGSGHSLAWRPEDDAWFKFDVGWCAVRSIINLIASQLESYPHLQSHGSIVAISKILAQQLAVRGEFWDSQEMLLGAPGITVDLRNGLTYQPDPHEYISKQTSCAPAQGPATKWLEFLGDITANNADMIEFIERVLGSCLTASRRDQKFFFFYGSGANGKSVLVDTAKEIMGDYARVCPGGLFTETKTDVANLERGMADLVGVRLVSASETAESSYFNEQAIKSFLGDSQVAARHIYKTGFAYRPSGHLIIQGNHLPKLRDTGESMRRRLVLIHLDRVIPEESRDPDLMTKLSREYPQILNRLLQACVRWHQSGLNIPPAVTAYGKDYIASEDAVGCFLAECFNSAVAGRTDVRVTVKIAYSRYVQWATEQGMAHKHTVKGLTKALRSRGFFIVKSHSEHQILGIEE